MLFNSLWDIILGIFGGVISSVIVSRVFLIQSEYQNQLRFVSQNIRRLGIASGYLYAIRAIFEVSYDTDLSIQREMEQRGYKTEDEYYAAHRDKDWIAKKDVLDIFLSELKQIASLIKSDIVGISVDDSHLQEILTDISKYVSSIAALNELTFSKINELVKQFHTISATYENYKRLSTQQIFVLALKDKLMIVVYILFCLLIGGAIVAHYFGV